MPCVPLLPEPLTHGNSRDPSVEPLPACVSLKGSRLMVRASFLLSRCHSRHTQSQPVIDSTLRSVIPPIGRQSGILSVKHWDIHCSRLLYSVLSGLFVLAEDPA